MTANLAKNTVAFEKEKHFLSEADGGTWLVYHDGTLIDRFVDFEEAYFQAVTDFGVGNFSIKNIRDEEAFAPVVFVEA